MDKMQGFRLQLPPAATLMTEAYDYLVKHELTPKLIKDIEYCYIPLKGSGVTIGLGVDLGQMSLNQLQNLGIPDDLIKKIRPVLGLIGDGATRMAHSGETLTFKSNSRVYEFFFTLSKDEIDLISKKVLESFVIAAISILRRCDCTDLPLEIFLVFLSRVYNQGSSGWLPVSKADPQYVSNIKRLLITALVRKDYFGFMSIFQDYVDAWIDDEVYRPRSLCFENNLYKRVESVGTGAILGQYLVDDVYYFADWPKVMVGKFENRRGGACHENGTPNWLFKFRDLDIPMIKKAIPVNSK